MKILAVDGPFRGQEIEFHGLRAPKAGEWVATTMLGTTPKQLEAYEYEAVKAGPHTVCRVRASHVYDVDPVLERTVERPAQPSDVELLRPLIEAIRDGRLRISGGSLEWRGDVKCTGTIAFWDTLKI